MEKYINEYCKIKKIVICIQCCKDWQELRGLLKKGEPNVVIIAQNGVEGLDIITGMKIMSGRLIWFSDLNFGLQAYRLCVSYFNMKPISYDKMAYALDYIDLN